MKGRRKNILILLIVVIAMAFFVKRCSSLSGLENLFSSKPVVIDSTPILIKEIKSIAQLTTITMYDEVVVESTITTTAATVINSMNAVAPLPVLPAPTKRIVLIGRGKVLAGTDLKMLQKEDIHIAEDTITVHLPKAIILDAIMNPSDFETFDEKGKWTDEEVRSVKLKARQKMIDHAIERGVLNKANVKAKEVMTNFFKSAGYKEIRVE